MSETLAVDSSAEEVDFLELWLVVWRGKLLILGVTSIFTAAAIFYALSKPDIYQATAILAPASISNTSSLSSLAGQFGGLASLAGVSLGGANGGDKSVVAMELIKTWGFLENFINNNHLEVEVFAVKGWNKAKNTLILDDKLYDEETSRWVRNFDSETKETSAPTSWELFGRIKNRININQDQKTGLISLSVEHYSPFVAKEWVDLLVNAINQHIQAEDKREAMDSIAYLKEQVNRTSIAEMQTIFYQLIEEQAKTLMLAEITSEYVFKTLSPAKVPAVKHKPKRILIVVFGIVMGGFLSVFFTLVRFYLGKSKG